MVLLNVKRSDQSLFLYETTVKTPIKELIPELVDVQNRRLRIKRFLEETPALLQYGPYKPLAEHGLDPSQLEAFNDKGKEKEGVVELEAGKRGKNKAGIEVMFSPDPTGRRMGEAPVPELAEVVNKAMAEAKLVIDDAKVKQNVCIRKEELQSAYDTLRGAIMIAFPHGLPGYDPVAANLADKEDLAGSAAGKEVYDEKATTVWWAAKEMFRGKTLEDYLGRNEKTKVVIKLQKKGQGPPVREPMVDEQTQKNMMAYYYKKQEAHKALEENDEDAYLNSSWANPRSLKNSFQGMGGGVSWRPGM